MHLAWKEYREALPVALIGAGLVLVFAIRPLLLPEAGWSELPLMRDGFFQGGSAILFFIALILGITSYAVEEEEETLEPLLARPITPEQVHRQKLMVRSAVLGALLVWFALLITVIGAWGTQLVQGALVGFPRWLGSVSLTALGFGLGLWFGRARKTQTGGLVAAALVFGAFWVLLKVSPMKLVFDDPEGGYRFEWVRSILLPAVGAVATFVLAARQQHLEDARKMTAGQVAAGALVAYGVVIWTLSMLPSGMLGGQGLTAYRHFLTLRFGGPESVLELMVGEPSAPQFQEQSEQDLAQRILSSMVDRGYDWTIPARYLTARRYAYYWGRYYSLDVPRPMTQYEEYLLTHRSTDFFRDMLGHIVEESPGTIPSLWGLHIAALGGEEVDPEGFSRIAASPDRPDRVRAVASMVLRSRGRSLEGELQSAVSTLINEHWYLTYYVAEFAEAVRPTMTEWVISDDRERRQAARVFFREHGTMADRDLLLASIEKEQAYNQRMAQERPDWNRRVPDIRTYELAWATEEHIPMVRSRAEELAEQLDAMRPGVDRLLHRMRIYEERAQGRQTTPRYTPKVPEEVTEDLRSVTPLVRSMDDYLRKLCLLGDRAALEIWTSTRWAPRWYSASSYSSGYIDRTQGMLPYLGLLGEPAYDYLEALQSESDEDLRVRWQAMAILAYHGQTDHVDELIGIWWRESEILPEEKGADMEAIEALRRRGWAPTYWRRDGAEILGFLAREGNERIAGALILNAARCLPAGGEQAWYTSRDGIGTWYWNTALVEDLVAVTGEDFGWDVGRWSTWWRSTHPDLVMITTEQADD